MNDTNILNSRKKINIFIMIMIGLGALGALLRTISIFIFYDKEIAYFQRGAILPIILYAVYALSVLLFAIMPFILAKNKAEIAPPFWRDRSLLLVPAGVMVYYALTQFSSLVKVDDSSPVHTVSRYEVIILIVSLISVAFFVSLAFSKKDSIVPLILSVGFFLWFILTWITTYLEFYTAINSPDKFLFHFGSIGAALFMVAELRVIYGFPKPRLYYFSLGCAIISLSVSSVPYIVGSFADAISGTLLIEESVVHFALLIYTIGRAVNLIRQSLGNESQKSIQEEDSETKNDSNDSNDTAKESESENTSEAKEDQAPEL